MPLLGLPDVRQAGAFDCGSAAVACVLRFLGKRRGRGAIAEAMLTNPLDGTDPRAIESYLRRQGLRVLSGEMTLSDLRNFTRSGRPVICLSRVTTGCGHYVVVAGRERSAVHFQCPVTGPGCRGDATFLQHWSDEDRLGADYRRWGIAVGRAG